MISSLPTLYYEASSLDTNLLYETQLRSVDPMIYLKNGTSSYLVVRDLELPRLSKFKQFTRVFSNGEVSRWGGNGTFTNDPTTLIPSLLNHLSISTVQVPYSFPAALLRSLENQGIQLSIMTDRFLSDRTIKTKKEIDHIQASQRAAEAAMKEVESILRASKTVGSYLKYKGKVLRSEFLKCAINETLLKKGCTTEGGLIVACGKDSYEPHNEGSGPIRPHLPIIVDIFPRSQSHHYWGDLTRTFVKGTPSPELLGIYRSVKKAQSLALSLLKPGVSCLDIHRAVVQSFESDHFKTSTTEGFIHGTGHGVGLDIHELPIINKIATDHLVVGNVITIEPGLYYPKIGGVRLEDTVVITSTGYKNLTRYPKRFLIS